jgi:hypothetical protein
MRLLRESGMSEPNTTLPHGMRGALVWLALNLVAASVPLFAPLPETRGGGAGFW